MFSTSNSNRKNSHNRNSSHMSHASDKDSRMPQCTYCCEAGRVEVAWVWAADWVPEAYPSMV